MNSETKGAVVSLILILLVVTLAFLTPETTVPTIKAVPRPTPDLRTTTPQPDSTLTPEPTGTPTPEIAFGPSPKATP